jgi:hypothetical protein
MFYILVDAVSCERGRNKIGKVGWSLARLISLNQKDLGFLLSLSQRQIYYIYIIE